MKKMGLLKMSVFILAADYVETLIKLPPTLSGEEKIRSGFTPCYHHLYHYHALLSLIFSLSLTSHFVGICILYYSSGTKRRRQIRWVRGVTGIIKISDLPIGLARRGVQCCSKIPWTPFGVDCMQRGRWYILFVKRRVVLLYSSEVNGRRV